MVKFRIVTCVLLVQTLLSPLTYAKPPPPSDPQTPYGLCSRPDLADCYKKLNPAKQKFYYELYQKGGGNPCSAILTPDLIAKLQRDCDGTTEAGIPCPPVTCPPAPPPPSPEVRETQEDANAIRRRLDDDREPRTREPERRPSSNNSGFGDFFSSFGGGALLGALGGGVLGYFLGRDSRSGSAQNQQQFPANWQVHPPGQFFNPMGNQRAPAFLPLINGQRNGLPQSYQAPFTPGVGFNQMGNSQGNFGGGGWGQMGNTPYGVGGWSGAQYFAGGGTPSGVIYNGGGYNGGGYAGGASNVGYFPGGSFPAQYPVYNPNAPAILPFPGP